MVEQLESIGTLDTDLLFRLKYYSDMLNIPLRLVVQNLLISEWAWKAAKVEVEGASPSRILPEFQWDIAEDGSKTLVTGEDLFNRLVATYKWELEQPLREQRLIAEQRELNQYLLPGEKSANIEELRRRRDKAEFLKKFPDKEAAWDRAEARQREYETKRKQDKLK